MTPVFKSLEQIATGYSVFEKDQVLTHEQLNSVASYADDQNRLTRVRLNGVGIGCGLRASLAGNVVAVTRGVGVTTDGDILSLPANTSFTQFKSYDASYPAYPPLYVGGNVNGTMIAAWELLAEGVVDDRAEPLSGFAAESGFALSDMTALLLMESYLKDEDLCTGTDCDNLGIEAINTIKLLLVHRNDVAALVESVTTPHAASSSLEEIVADRPIVPLTLASYNDLAQIYRSACANIHTKLDVALRKIYPACSAFISSAITSDPAPSWMTRLTQIQSSFASVGTNIQYYYDLLKDIVETHNELCLALFDDTTWCLPDPTSFPKHLLLGDLATGSAPEAHRTGFYPSPFASRTRDQVERIVFLIRKIDAMIRGFQVNSATSTPIRITPSRFEEARLEDRAIPFYYPPTQTIPIHQLWSYDLHRRGMDRHNYSYNASAYNARGGAADPLRSQLGRFSFFRIEGHLGKNVSTALTTIENEINSRNLPIVVRSIFLGSDRTKVVKKPGRRYSDLRRMHYLLRQDLTYRLEETETFSARFKDQVDAAVAANVVVDNSDDNDGAAVRELASQKNTAVKSGASSARAKVGGSYSAYKASPTWKQDVSATMQSAGEFKHNLSPVVKAEFDTPFDGLIGNVQADWLDWLDQIIDQKEQQSDERLLFKTFAAEHPGIEHFAGVLRGGTFVLVYDANNTVVADFMLPYDVPEEGEPEPDEPSLTKPGVRPAWVVDNGVKVVSSRNTYVKKKIEDFRMEFEPKMVERINFQEKYLSTFKDSVQIIKDVYTPTRTIGEIKYDDALLGVMVEENTAKRTRIDLLREKAAGRNVTEIERREIETEIDKLEDELAINTRDVADYVAKANLDPAAGGDAQRAVAEIGKSAGTIKGERGTGSLRTGLGDVAKNARNQNLRNALGGLLGP